MTKTQKYLYWLIAQLLLLCAVGVATLCGQTSVPKPAQALAAAAPAHADSPAPAGSSAPIVRPPTASAKGEFIGDVKCRNCHKHDKIWDNFFKDPHFKSVASAKESPDKTGCEGCHGPGKAHVDAGGDKDTVVYAFSAMKSQQIVALCLNCHKKEFSRANIKRSEHTQHDVACTSCHS